ncbi:unnamed protein product [Brassicogethes aeneus]|uniref:furin n=1 Tax=Brassicogethes aeneus TaxID=1431903 RepID=A0A9P0B1R9_BRAAE|nr:unnamed protein product [Brassicogethes aeneus]
MVVARSFVLISFVFCFVHAADGIKELVVRLKGGPLVAQLLAKESGYFYKGPVTGFDDTFILKPIPNAYPTYNKRGKTIEKRLSDDQRVEWAEEQTSKERHKRDFIEPEDVPHERTKRISNNKRKIYKRPPPPLGKNERIFNDELWTQEWYLQDTRTRPDLPKLDLNVLPVYKSGISGKDVRISILDDGIEYTHDDLIDNYDPDISYDCNQEDLDPIPRYDVHKSNSHGTRCAGEVAMTANNKICGVGIAFNSKIGGVKMLDGLVTDRIEGTALGYALDLVDIYSASWGPKDDGKTVDGPGRLAKESLEKGITMGRNGRGSIYVWASGNGGSKGDNCNCDGYLASIFTISIGSASQKGEFPWYGEECASTLAVTYSSGAYKDQMIATTDLNNECTIKHTGTSASAPLAAGIIALALEVNPNLTWRDVQYLVVWTSEPAPVVDNPGWQLNAAGFWFNTRFGFGLMNAYGFVKAAANWTNVPDKSLCSIRSNLGSNTTISYGNPLKILIFTTGCQNTDQEINYLEHLQLKTNINYSVRGVLDITITSPSGSTIQVLAPRKFDKSKSGFRNWTFMSVMTWGEKVHGTWIVTITDNIGPEGNNGNIGETTLTLHGTKYLPEHMRNGRRNYDHNYNRVNSRFHKKDMISENLYYSPNEDNLVFYDEYLEK